jgi:hypothetical protein
MLDRQSRIALFRPSEPLAMQSPFPGMDPYLEPLWGDVHHSMITRARDAIQKQLPRELVARINVREFVEPIESWPRNEGVRFLRLRRGRDSFRSSIGHQTAE